MQFEQKCLQNLKLEKELEDLKNIIDQMTKEIK